MIKQIQLRGISRTPSDRMTSDGGCAESLNVCLDGQETAPVQAPEDISYSVYGERYNTHVVYIHKMDGITWYIGYEKGCLTAYGPLDEENFPAVYVFKEFGSSESVENVISMGNTLIVYTNEKPYYFLFKDNTYHFLGNEIPTPKIEIVSRPNFSAEPSDGYIIYPSLDMIVDTGTTRFDYEGIAKAIWERAATATAQEREDGHFFAPFFIRYAVKLYDGNYINCSVPILCGGGEETWMTLSVVGSPAVTHLKLNEIFTVKVKMSYTDISNWSDLISSIDFFASQPIYTPAFNSAIESYNGDTDEYIFKGMNDRDRDKTVLEAVLSKSNFYRIASFSVESKSDMAELMSGSYTIRNSDDIGGEKLAAHPELPDSYRDGIQRTPLNGVQTYNGRLMLLGCKETLPRGHMFLGGTISKVELEWPRDWPVYPLYFRFKLDASGEPKYVFGHYGNVSRSDDKKRFLPSVVETTGGLDGLKSELLFSNEIDYSGPFYAAVPHAWLCYPDSRCTEVIVYDHLGQAVKIPMKPHPFLECSYAFFGFGKSLYTMITQWDISDETLIEDNVVNVPNKLFQSEFENPFIFPVSGIITFPDNIIDVVTTSVPLSQGQFGQFPLYVFTGGGIRVLSISETGEFLSNNTSANLSRHIALPGTIYSIEQAVIFTTERGVMLLSGGTVSDLSANMNGAPYMVDEDLKALLTSSEWAELVSTVCDNGAFMEFMRKSKVAYDSNGSRLLFFSEGNPYAYVYVIPTQTWHKVHFPESNITILNSYPECLISTGSNDGSRMWNFSSKWDDSDYLSDVKNAVKGIVITRPFDLEAPDVRKVIKDIRVRGHFNKGDVKYILLGSFDGTSWKRLTSLRGGSYKLFRIALLCNLAPMERVSWIDIDFDTRFNTRLR